jgi:hypothetical protein
LIAADKRFCIFRFALLGPVMSPACQRAGLLEMRLRRVGVQGLQEMARYRRFGDGAFATPLRHQRNFRWAQKGDIRAIGAEAARPALTGVAALEPFRVKRNHLTC